MQRNLEHAIEMETIGITKKVIGFDISREGNGHGLLSVLPRDYFELPD